MAVLFYRGLFSYRSLPCKTWVIPLNAAEDRSLSSSQRSSRCPHLHPRDLSSCPVPLHQWRSCMRRVLPLCGLIAPGLAVEFIICVHQGHLPGRVPFHLILSSMPVVWINSSADRADDISQWLAETRQHTGSVPPNGSRRSIKGSMWAP